MNGPVAVLRDGTRIDLHERSELIGRIKAYVHGLELKDVLYASEVDGEAIVLARGEDGRPLVNAAKDELVEDKVTGPIEIRIDGEPAVDWIASH